MAKVWIVQGNYEVAGAKGWEDEDARPTEQEGRESLKTYREATRGTGYRYRLISRDEDSGDEKEI